MAVAAEAPDDCLADDDFEEENRPRGNNLKLWGNITTMNLNTMIYTNIQQSPYFKSNLTELKTYHEVIDEIYYKVEHLEPWERGSRRMGSQTGMCGGVRGVGSGGIVSTAYCLLFKLFTLKLTRKQLKGLLEHPDSPYIRGLGFMYIRYCLPPEDFWMWYAPYLDDTEEIDVRAGGGCTMTIGAMLEQWLTKLDWFSTLFPRIPVPVQKKLEEKLKGRRMKLKAENTAQPTSYGDAEKLRNRSDSEPSDRLRHEHLRSGERGDDRYRGHNRSHHRSRSPDRGGVGRGTVSSGSNRYRRSRSPRHRESSFDRDLRRARARQEKLRR